MIRFRSLALALALCSLALVPLAGCGGESLTLVSVKGKVLVDGQPLTKGSVRFVPDKAKGNTTGVEPVGTIGADGGYELTTNGKPGAPPGGYLVSVSSGEIPDSTKPLATKTAVASRFSQPDTSKLTVEVVATPAAGAYDLKVSAK